MNISESCGGSILVQSEKNKIANCNFVDFGSDVRVQTKTVEGVAENKGRLGLGIIKLPDAELVASAEEMPLANIPQREYEVSDEVSNTVFAPSLIGVEN